MILLYILLTLLGTFLIGTLAGYAIHWVLHQSWGGRLYEAHATHHDVLYPPSDLFSDEYRDAGKDDTLLKFAIPIVALGFVPLLFLPFWLWALSFVALLVGGYAHEYLHTQFHLNGTWLLRYRWFCRLVDLHILHHEHQEKNLGIYSFLWDRVFGTYINWGDIDSEGSIKR